MLFVEQRQTLNKNNILIFPCLRYVAEIISLQINRFKTVMDVYFLFGEKTFTRISA